MNVVELSFKQTLEKRLREGNVSVDDLPVHPTALRRSPGMWDIQAELTNEAQQKSSKGHEPKRLKK